MSKQSKDRVRVTISLSKDIVDRVDEITDGIKIRNRSHAIESLITDSLDLSFIQRAVVLAGGENVLETIPAIKEMLALLAKYGIFQCIVAVGYLGKEVKQELGDGTEEGVKITYSQSEMGTGGSLLPLASKLKSTFIVVNCNTSIEVDIKNLVQFHRTHQPVATIATKSLKTLEGVYVLDPAIFTYIPTEKFCMLEEAVFSSLTAEGKLLFYPLTN